MNPSPRSPARPRAFTLTEVLVVVALIAVLISILLTALAKVQTKSRQTSTLATMQAFANACEIFHGEHGYYPGLVPEQIVRNNPNGNLSSTELALFDLLGGGWREADDPEYPSRPGLEVSYNDPAGGQYRVKIDVTGLGDGPVINGKAYAPYFAPTAKNYGVPEQVGPGGVQRGDDYDPDSPPPPGYPRPDLLDAWGNPIMMARRQRPSGPITSSGAPQTAQFHRVGMLPYLLASPPYNDPGPALMSEYSILSPTNDPAQTNLAILLGHPSIAGQARGAFMLLSGGKDTIYLSKTDGLGTSSAPVTDLASVAQRPADILPEYDDIAVFGGG